MTLNKKEQNIGDTTVHIYCGPAVQVMILDPIHFRMGLWTLGLEHITKNGFYYVVNTDFTILF